MSGRIRAMRYVGLLALALLLAGCQATPSTPAAAKRPVLRIAGSRLAEALTRELAKARPDLDVQHIASSPLTPARQVRDGEAELGVTFADSVYFAHLADGDIGRSAREHIRAISALHVAPILMFARPGSGIRSPTDVKGHPARIAPTPVEGDPRFSGWPVPRSLSGSGTGTVSGITSLPQLVLLAYGITPADVENHAVSPSDAIVAMGKGTLDAVFAMAFEANSFAEQALKQGQQLIPIEGAAVDRLRHEYAFIRPVTIPAGTYPGQVTAVRTVGVNMVLVCRTDLDEQLAYDLTRLYFAALPRIAEQGDVPGIDPQQAPLTPIPLHDGAARYYRETELFR